MNFEDFKTFLLSKACTLSKAVYTSVTGISPIVSESIINDCGFDSALPPSALSEDELYH